jgi:hypothetical protein
LSIYDNNFLYYACSNYSVSAVNRLQPLTEGLQVIRSTGAVNTLASYSANGTLPYGIVNGVILFNSTNLLSIGSTSTLNNLNLGTYLNPLSSNWNVY